jgi:hypothetical protein
MISRNPQPQRQPIYHLSGEALAWLYVDLVRREDDLDTVGRQILEDTRNLLFEHVSVRDMERLETLGVTGDTLPVALR